MRVDALFVFLWFFASEHSEAAALLRRALMAHAGVPVKVGRGKMLWPWAGCSRYLLCL